MTTAELSDFLILGGGIAGASAGFFLAEHGSVTVLEAEDAPGYHATGRSAALFTEYFGNRCIRALTTASRSFYAAPPAGFAEHPLLTPRGVVMLAPAGAEDRFAASLAEASRDPTIPPLHEIGPDEVQRLCPAVRRGWYGRALHKPAAMDVDVHGAHHGFLRGLRSRGGRVVAGAEAQEIVRDRGDGMWRVSTPAGTFAAKLLINAAGAWADAVAGLAGVRPVGLSAMRRTAFTFDPPAGTEVASWPMVTDLDDTFYVKPEAGRLLASPCDETPMPPCDVQADEIDVATAAARVEEVTTLTIRRVTHRWAGLRTFVRDRTVVVGEAPAAPGFFWLAGQGGYGIQTAPAVARACAALATEGRLPADLARLGITEAELSPARFS